MHFGDIVNIANFMSFSANRECVETMNRITEIFLDFLLLNSIFKQEISKIPEMRLLLFYLLFLINVLFFITNNNNISDIWSYFQVITQSTL